MKRGCSFICSFIMRMFEQHTPLGMGDIVKVERVPDPDEYTSWETELNQTDITTSLHGILSTRKEQSGGGGYQLCSLGENLPRLTASFQHE